MASSSDKNSGGPPQVVDLERQILGAALTTTPARDVAVDQLTVADFYDPVHQNIFGAIDALTGQERSADVAAVGAELARQGLLVAAGGHEYLADLVANCTNRDPNVVRDWGQSVLNAARLRALAATAPKISEIVESGITADHALEAAEVLLGEIAPLAADQALGMDELLEEQQARIEQIRSGDIETGFSTGIKSLDNLIGGLVEERVYVVAARPGMGKTSLAHGIALHTAEKVGRPVLIASLEMRHMEVTDRLMANHARIDHARMTEATLEEDEEARYKASVEALRDKKIEVLDDVSLTVPTIRAAARRTRSRYGDLGLVIIDYLTLLTPHARAGSRQEEVALISRAVKVLARQLQTAVVVVAQLSRKVEERTDKRPILSDLRESGQIEQDCDVALMLYRDEHYNPYTEFRGVAEIIVAKNRHGKTGTATAAWAGSSMAFFDLPDHIANSLPASSGPASGNPAAFTGNTGQVEEF